MAAIVVAAERVVAELGLQGATTARIAKVAGVSIGSVYQYFPNKTVLASIILKRRTDEFEQAIRETVRDSRDLGAIERLFALGARIAAIKLRDAALYRELLAEEATLEGTEWVERVRESGQQAVLAILATERLRADVDLETASFVLTSAVDGVLERAMATRPHELAGARLLGELRRMLVAYVGAITVGGPPIET